MIWFETLTYMDLHIQEHIEILARSLYVIAGSHAILCHYHPRDSLPLISLIKSLVSSVPDFFSFLVFSLIFVEHIIQFLHKNLYVGYMFFLRFFTPPSLYSSLCLKIVQNSRLGLIFLQNNGHMNLPIYLLALLLRILKQF